VRSLSDVVRFFAVVPPVSRMMTATFVVVAAVAAALLVVDPTAGSRAMRPILLLQAFAAASGFTVPARRGHYDLLLTRGHRRTVVAVTQWAMSSAPGAASWVVLGLVELAVVASGEDAAIPTFGTAASLFVVSAVAWALTAPLPRFAGGIGWLLVLALSSMLPLDIVRRVVTGGTAGQWRWNAVRAFVAPQTMIGLRWADAGAVPVWPAIGIAAAWLVAAVRRIEREDFRLDAGQ
jgi:hypothetical protein